MFTGIVEEIGKIKKIEHGSNSIALTIQANKVLGDVKLGDSIATNGVCLTVTDFKENEFTVDVMPETLRNSSLADLKIGHEVNLERALRVGDRLGGHLVSGHIDGVGSIRAKKREDNAVVVTIAPPKELLRYIIPKGSITIDGVSLTVAQLEANTFDISLIPHTAQITILGKKNVGNKVNLEVDLIGKYVERMMEFSEEEEEGSDSNIDINMLKDKGFLFA
ncbi:riboflavin synthase [Natroniella sulfidigena]|uniref:riboflavin synthase n=1 Tax=Natroniella sulfidigena TaxID=723921 RepID=UPI002009DD99|nr:riboflavin synthase [Natroniella sulfidigena]MCK8817810.1 riboflavin synthase [Natroniella sulfidigena]